MTTLAHMSTQQKLLLAVLTPFLLWAAWPAGGVAPLLLIAFVPLLILEDTLLKEKSKRLATFGIFYLSFLLFNLATTWWVWNASPGGSVMAFLFNSFFMTLVFLLFHAWRKRWKSNYAYILLPLAWIGFEYIHMNWDASWPWLTLANGWAAWYKCVQWYEYTGFAGGTAWIWACNILLFLLVKKIRQQERITRPATMAFLVVAVPLVISLVRYYTYVEKEDPVNIVISQPNLDPYSDKFYGDNTAHMNRLLALAKSNMDSSTQYLVAPETAIAQSMWEEDLNLHRITHLFQNFAKTYPNLEIVIGASTDRLYPGGIGRTPTARKFTRSDDYYDSYNTALQYDSSKQIQIYHKSKLVPGVEKMPFPALLKPLENFAIDLGGTSGSLGSQAEVSVFKGKKMIAPVICYESVYGAFVNEYIEKGAELIFIITNDGWWGNTPGYRQHLQYARLRAIEMRRSIARSANTGISAFINQRGDILQQTEWWKESAIAGTLNGNNIRTFYSYAGDRLAYPCCLALFVMIVALFFSKAKKRNDATDENIKIRSESID
ncbi:MAG: apolipoprotein N-acyltransferase [Bacteroidetes bacterium]|nr:apolipoprotein N-acyltransferase [Bacteroidota bacterium]